MLIASLALDILDPRVVLELLRLSRIGEIPLLSIDHAAARLSLRQRGTELHTEVVGDGHATFQALELEAVATTADSLDVHQVHWLGQQTTFNKISLVNRAACAAAWNHVAGVLT